MFKTGICSLDELKDKRRRRGVFGGRRLPSIALYAQAAAHPDGTELAEQVLDWFADDRGAYKRTYQKRFVEFDNAALGVMQQRFTPDEALVLHDLGVSDARTACDFFALVAGAYPKLNYFASDYAPGVEIVQVGDATVAYSLDGAPVEVAWPPFVHSVHRHENFLFYPFNYLHRRLAFATLLPKADELRRQGAGKPLALWSPRAVTLEKSDPRFHLLRHDLTKPLPGRGVSVVRAMNVLNEGYFTGEQLVAAGTHFLDALVEGGLLIAGRNGDPDSPVVGAIYESVGGRFALKWRNGVEVPYFEPFILGSGRPGA